MRAPRTLARWSIATLAAIAMSCFVSLAGTIDTYDDKRPPQPAPDPLPTETMTLGITSADEFTYTPGGSLDAGNARFLRRRHPRRRRLWGRGPALYLP
jgi:hypothetical protein